MSHPTVITPSPGSTDDRASLDEMREQVRSLGAEVDSLRRRLGDMEVRSDLTGSASGALAPTPAAPAITSCADSGASPDPDPAIGRRRFLRGAGAAATGAAGLLALEVVQAQPAAAATVIGNGNPGVRGVGTGGDGVVGSTDSGGMSGVYGYAPSTGAVGVTGRNFGNSNAIEGLANGIGRGVYAYSAAGTGLEAVSGTGVGIDARGTVGMTVAGSRAALLIYQADGVSPYNRTDTHADGEIYRHATGALWYCVSSGTPGEWRKLSAWEAAGVFHVLTSTVRAYDSRPGYPPIPVTKGVLANAAERLVNCQSAGLPARCTAVLVNLTVTDTSASGWLAAYKGGIAYPGNSSINWSQPGSIVANSAVVALDSFGQFTVKVSGASSTHFVVDLVGYYQ